jgi:hypothetical protein
VSRHPDLRAVVTVYSGTAWMTRSRSSQGRVMDVNKGGLAIPLEVAGAAPAAYLSLLRARFAHLGAALRRGAGVLGATSARLRRLKAGATLVFGADQVPIVAVVPDAAIGGHELFVSARTALGLGVTKPRYLLVRPRDRAHVREAVRDLGAELPAGEAIRIRRRGQTPYLRQADAVLPPVRLKALFGEFSSKPLPGGYLASDPAWERQQIVEARVPILGKVRCNREVIPLLRGALGALASRGLSNLVKPDEYGGCYSPRFSVRDPSASISHHSWGIAIDINVAENAYGAKPTMDPRVVAEFERWGFIWGGRFIVPDGMHFEFHRWPAGR